jgi:hypothetical protein
MKPPRISAETATWGHDPEQSLLVGTQFEPAYVSNAYPNFAAPNLPGGSPSRWARLAEGARAGLVAPSRGLGNVRMAAAAQRRTLGPTCSLSKPPRSSWT